MPVFSIEEGVAQTLSIKLDVASLMKWRAAGSGKGHVAEKWSGIPFG